MCFFEITFGINLKNTNQELDKADNYWIVNFKKMIVRIRIYCMIFTIKYQCLFFTWINFPSSMNNCDFWRLRKQVMSR